MMPATATAWMRANLTTQGYGLSDAERRRLAVGLRFSTGLCLSLAVVAFALQSPIMVFALSGIGMIAGFTARHPFDYLWNHGVRNIFGAPVLPPNPQRRRDAFKVATVWLGLVGVLLAAGATTAGLVLGGLLVAACAARHRHQPVPPVGVLRLARAPAHPECHRADADMTRTRTSPEGSPAQHHRAQAARPGHRREGRASVGYISAGLTVLLLAAAAPCAQAQLVTTFPLPASLRYPHAITAGPDGALWFTQYNHEGDGAVAGVLGRITTAGVATAVRIPSRSRPVALTGGPDGALWYAAQTPGRQPARLGRVAAEGVTEAQLPAGENLASGVVTGPDHALWFTAKDRIGRLVPGAAPTFFKIKGARFLDRIVVGSDGALWFTDFERPVIGRITTAGVSQIFRTPIKDRVDNPTDGIDELAAGTDGVVWFTSFIKEVVGRITSTGRVRMYRVGGVPGAITAGSDKGMWFTDVFGLRRIGRGGEMTEITLPEDEDAITDQEGIASGPDGAIWFTQTRTDLDTEAVIGSIGRLDLPAMADRILVARFAATPARARRNSRVRVAFASTRSAVGVLTLDLGKREVLRRKIRAKPGENIVMLRLPRRPGGYRLYLRLNTGRQAATHDRPLTVRP